MRRPVALVLIATILPGTRTAAQSASDYAAFTALITTPVGALPPAPPKTMVPGRIHTDLVYGTYKYQYSSRLHNVGFGFGRDASSLMLAFVTCDGCNSVIMAGFNRYWTLATAPADDPDASGAWRLGVRPSLGVSTPTSNAFETFLLSAAANFPVAITAIIDADSRLVPYLEPGVGVGHLQNSSQAETGLRFMLGGGVAYLMRRGAIYAGFRQIFVTDGPIQWGLGASLVPRE